MRGVNPYYGDDTDVMMISTQTPREGRLCLIGCDGKWLMWRDSAL